MCVCWSVHQKLTKEILGGGGSGPDGVDKELEERGVEVTVVAQCKCFRSEFSSPGSVNSFY